MWQQTDGISIYTAGNSPSPHRAGLLFRLGVRLGGRSQHPCAKTGAPRGADARRNFLARQASSCRGRLPTSQSQSEALEIFPTSKNSPSPFQNTSRHWPRQGACRSEARPPAVIPMRTVAGLALRPRGSEVCRPGRPSVEPPGRRVAVCPPSSPPLQTSDLLLVFLRVPS
jgi:hypothetical protein